MAGNREFVQKHPSATRRALRVILKAANIGALEPERAARFIVDKGFTPRYDYALETMGVRFNPDELLRDLQALVREEGER